MVSAVKDQSQYSSCWAFFVAQAVVLRLVLTSGGYRVDLFAQPEDFVPTRIQYVPHFSGASICVSLWWSAQSWIRPAWSTVILLPTRQKGRSHSKTRFKRFMQGSRLTKPGLQ